MAKMIGKHTNIHYCDCCTSKKSIKRKEERQWEAEWAEEIELDDHIIRGEE